MTETRFDVVTSWSARKRHLAEPGSPWLLCARGTAVRPGNLYAGRHKSEMTQERINAMDMCKGCAASAAKTVVTTEGEDD